MYNIQSYVWIVAVIIAFFLDNTQTAWLRCYRSSLNEYTVTSLSDPTPLMRDPCFDPNLRTVIYTFGYKGKTDGPATTAVLNTYLETKKRNVLLLDWQEEAQSGVLGIPLGYALYAVPNAKRVGHELGDALVTLSQVGLNMTEVHLMGHSLGAHIMAFAGRWTRKRGQVIARITGLDPARALFEGTFAINSGLDRTCAKFVDIIHTDPGSYGTSKSTGTVDLWPNYSREDGVQPGCPSGKFDMFTQEDLCSHDRAWRFLVESIRYGTAFPAAAAENYNTWLAMETPPAVTNYMGDLTNTKARGNYFLSTNEQTPFSKGSSGMIPDQSRRRRNSVNSPLSIIIKFFR
ncbi:phospholipase A1 VesT1.02-like isoform X1 [Vanessa tameamea]|uniref:Phospholipase A1 VesT1.02-like isoform X1 n=1 Tax=Vanessa tameamea TaxID=334116 RepID=A0A8B8HJ96_VANTA